MNPIKGALVVFETPAPVPTDIIVFQFNAENLSRSVKPPEANTPAAAKRGKGSPSHQTKRPTESLTVSIELDASDQLLRGNTIAESFGVHPALAQLELLAYPSAALLLASDILAIAGSPFVVPAFTPVVLFIWGPARVLPVQVQQVTITEQQFDSHLNPINAKVDLSLVVLDAGQLKQPFRTLATVNHVAKEAMARVGTVQSAGQISSLLPF